MIKWKLMLTTLPLVLTVALLKLVMEQVFGASSAGRPRGSNPRLFAKRAPVDIVYSAIDVMNPHFQAMDKAGATAHANRSIVAHLCVHAAIDP